MKKIIFHLPFLQKQLEKIPSREGWQLTDDVDLISTKCF